MQNYREEYPRPQFIRKDWINLNGEWQFEIDNAKSGTERGLYRSETSLSERITVPFCPESRLSGLEHKDFMYGVWYKRVFSLPDNWSTGRTVLHFGAVDYYCTAYINGVKAGSHKGGYCSFSFDITDLLTAGENTITVYAQDDTRDPMIPSGKQCRKYASSGAEYTRTTGIWQTVWLEHKPDAFIDSVKYYTDIKSGTLTVKAALCGSGNFSVTAFYHGKEVGGAMAESVCGEEILTVKLSEIHLWEAGCGRLYDLELNFGSDCVKSYFGLRKIHLADGKFYLNDRSVFQRLILDQGFYPDGIYTAPTDTDLKKDIELSMQAGFNGARLHQKIFEERYLYYCDKMGYLVWGEFPDWGLDHTNPDSIYSILPEWAQMLMRDFNHPSIIGWCPHNETADIEGRRQYDPGVELLYRQTKAIDGTRPCIDSSGWYHIVTDIYDVHDYNQDPISFKANFDRLITENYLSDENAYNDSRQHYSGEPVMVSEFGGIKWLTDEKQDAWGYGNAPKTQEEFLLRFRSLAEALLFNPKIFGFCYTQLTDVEQECNGLYTYDRKTKFDPKRLKEILEQKAAVED